MKRQYDLSYDVKSILDSFVGLRDGHYNSFINAIYTSFYYNNKDGRYQYWTESIRRLSFENNLHSNEIIDKFGTNMIEKVNNHFLIDISSVNKMKKKQLLKIKKVYLIEEITSSMKVSEMKKIINKVFVEMNV